MWKKKNCSKSNIIFQFVLCLYLFHVTIDLFRIQGPELLIYILQIYIEDIFSKILIQLNIDLEIMAILSELAASKSMCQLDWVYMLSLSEGKTTQHYYSFCLFFPFKILQGPIYTKNLID